MTHSRVEAVRYRTNGISGALHLSGPASVAAATHDAFTARRTMCRVGHARIPRAVLPSVRGHPQAVEVHVLLGIDDAGVQLIDLRHMQRQRLQVRLLDSEDLATAGMELWENFAFHASHVSRARRITRVALLGDCRLSNSELTQPSSLAIATDVHVVRGSHCSIACTISGFNCSLSVSAKFTNSPCVLAVSIPRMA